MRRCQAGIGFAFALALSASSALAEGDSIPRWDIAEICAASTLGSKCPTLESQHRRTVFNRWEALPLADRNACEATVAASRQRSYKALLSCLGERQLKALEVTPMPAAAPARETGAGASQERAG